MKNRYLLVVFALVGITLFSAVIADGKLIELVQDVSVAKVVETEQPVRLMIPAIGTDALIESLGLTPEGIMDSPEGPANAGWYNLGVRPGEVGSAVIDGHSGWKNDTPAVFDNLHQLEPGDKIYIEDNKGIITTFVVRESRTYNPEADASEVFFSNDDGSHLNLITCNGVWNEVTQNSSKRLVIFADKDMANEGL